MTARRRALVAIAFWGAISVIVLALFATPEVWVGLGIAIATCLVLWQATWITLSWIESGDPRWWR